MKDKVLETNVVTNLTLNSDEVRRIEFLYGINVKNSTFLGMGSGNTNYCLETDIGRCVFSIIEEQNRDDVEIMAKTLVWLEEHNHKTSLLIRPKQQGSYSIILRGKYSLLRSYMLGAVCQDLSASMLRQLGAETAKLHSIPLPNFLSDSVFYEQQKFMDALDANIDRNYERWAKGRLKALAVGTFGDLPTSIIHSDLFYDNMLFDGDRLVGMIDFELTCIYHSVFDIGMAIVGTCSTDGKLSAEKAHHLIAGYQSIRTLKNSELDVLQRYTEYAAILTSLWRYWRYRIYQPDDVRADKFREMVVLANSIESTNFKTITDALPLTINSKP
ncbi:phosphotransferase [Pectobacterium colocasium]|uniref:phosphotransferase n=1 Tax=Pectobacterium colocasium TaxID=2878098 RepID=UPI0033065C98